MTPDTRPDGPDGPDDAPIGTVAHEAALLVNLLSTRGWGGGDAPGAPQQNGRDDAPGGGHQGADTGSGRDEPGRTSGEGRTHECTCGGTTPAACRVCPVCQLISFVQQVSPDAVDRLADVVGLAATALRDLATSQREQRERSGEGPERDGDREGAQPAP